MNKRRSFILRNISGWTLLVPSILLFIFLIWRPIIIGIGYSFFKLNGFTPTEFVGLKNYTDVITDTDFIQPQDISMDWLISQKFSVNATDTVQTAYISSLVRVLSVR